MARRTPQDAPEQGTPQFQDDEQPEFGRSDGQSAEEDAHAIDAAAEDKKAKDVDNQAILASLGATLYAKFQDVEKKRFYIEDRWLEDLRQFHGKYDPAIETGLVEAESCSLFLNITKPKTHAFSARVMDMVLPTDEKNWGLQPTPVPEIAGMASGLKGEVAPADALAGSPALTPGGQQGLGTQPGAPDSGQDAQEVPQMPPPGLAPAAGGATAPPAVPAPPGTQPQPQPEGPPGPMTTPEGAPVLKTDIVTAVKTEAQTRCAAMEDELDDQLSEAKYNAIQRKAIEQMSKLGAGIIMGPAILDEWLVTWKPQPNPVSGKSDYVRTLVPNTNKRPGVQFIDCWNFYPDMSAPDPAEWEFAFVMHLVNNATLKKYAKRFNFMEGPTKELLSAGPSFNAFTLRWLNELRSLSETNNTVDKRHRLLRYYGELNDDDLRAVGMDPEALGVTDTIHGTVWLCDDKVLKVDLNPLDSGDMPFSVCYCDKDEASPFGRGIPRLMRGEQESVNAAWRMMHDNAGLSVGPQIFMRENAVTPADGDYHMKPKKLWYVGDDVQNVNNVFAQFAIDPHMSEMEGLLQLGIRFADDVTQLPLIMQGDQAPHITQTAQGMSLLYNASTVVLRRTVKNYDDYTTEPMISRFYEWNMQFNTREDIKGDFRCVARGSSTLLDKEQQAKSLDTAMQLAMQPVWQPYTDMKKLYREACKAKRIPEIVLPDEEIDKNLAAQQKLAEMQAQAKAPQPQQQQPQVDPNALLALEQDKVNVMKDTNQLKREELGMKERVAAAEIASDGASVTTRAQSNVAAMKIKEDAANQRTAAELAHKTRLAVGGLK